MEEGQPDHEARDSQFETKPVARALARFLSFHPYNLAQKADVMIEHFQTFARHKIGATARATGMAGSRRHAVRYKQEFDKDLGARRHLSNCSGIRTLVRRV